MFEANKKRIGEHLAELIKSKGFKSDRQFGIEYLKLRYGSCDEAAIPNIQNRICQIKKGNKWIQADDLPYFSELLDVSIEEILSGGTVIAPVSNRKTNYSIATSTDQSDWEAYINREDKPFLNPDEFNKTIIDYAIETGNYPFLKFLMKHDYISFVGTDKSKYYTGFGAEVKIERRTIGKLDSLCFRMNEPGADDLRFKMIALALKHENSKNGFKMLDELHARELPFLYTVTSLQHMSLSKETLPLSLNTQLMLDRITSSEAEILSYFFEDFEIESAIGGQKNSFIFPFAEQVLERLIQSRKKTNAIKCLTQSIEHNERAQKKLQSLTDRSQDAIKERNSLSAHPEIYSDNLVKREAWNLYDFYPATGFVAYHMPLSLAGATGFITNVIRVTSKSNDPDIQVLIDKLNNSYNSFERYLKNKEADV